MKMNKELNLKKIIPYLRTFTWALPMLVLLPISSYLDKVMASLLVGEIVLNAIKPASYLLSKLEGKRIASIAGRLEQRLTDTRDLELTLVYSAVPLILVVYCVARVKGIPITVYVMLMTEGLAALLDLFPFKRKEG